MNPLTRREKWYKGIIDGATDMTPATRREFWYKGIIDGRTELTPTNRREYWYKGIIDGRTDLTPTTRREFWYKGIIDGQVDITPLTRDEEWLYEIVQKGGGGGGGGDDDGLTKVYVTLTEDLLNPAVGLAVNGEAEIDWGDGSAKDTLTGTSLSNVVYTPQHTYAAAGDYVVSIRIIDGSAAISIGSGGGGGGGSSTYKCMLLYNPQFANNPYAACIRGVEIGDNVTLGEYALYNATELESVTGVDVLRNYAFSGCSKLTEIEFVEGITSVGQGCFRNTGFVSLSLPDSITSIGAGAFYGCASMETISLPPALATIGNTAPRSCTALKSISIPSSVTSIGTNVFSGDTSLEGIRFKGVTPPTASRTSFANIPTTCKIYVPAGSLGAYTSATGYPNPATYEYIEE